MSRALTTAVLFFAMCFVAMCFVAMCFVAMSASLLLAADQQACMTRDQQQTAVTDGKAVPLASALKAVQGRGRQVVRAQLCHAEKGLVYVLTVLARDGKVTRVRVDAAGGGLIDEL